MKLKRWNKPTIIKQKWLKENYSKFECEKELLNAMQEEFGGCDKRIRDQLRIFYGEKENTSSWRGKMKSKDNGNCYFCANEDTISHHISYIPEVVISLCISCHNKLHFINNEQHNLEKQRYKSFIELMSDLDKFCTNFCANKKESLSVKSLFEKVN